MNDSRRIMTTISTLVVAAALAAGCAAGEDVEGASVPPVVSPSASAPAATPTPTAEPARGSRGNPLSIGETRKLSAQSMWSVGATAATESGDGYVVLPLKIELDWAAADEQLETGDPSFSETGVDPSGSLFIEFVSASGRSYDELAYDADVRNQLWEIGTVYPPAESVEVTQPVSVPQDEVAGGLWVVKNARGEAVFISAD